jgi:hypothetical protein
MERDMKKLRLGLEQLKVQSFATSPLWRRGEGTVHGQAEAEDTWTNCPPGCVTDIKTDNQSECFPADCA